jgi:hypothetical protein
VKEFDMAENSTQQASRLYKEKVKAETAQKRGAELPLGGKPAKMKEPYPGNMKAASAAYDKLQNMRESDTEVAAERYLQAQAQKKTDRTPYNWDKSATPKGK